MAAIDGATVSDDRRRCERIIRGRLRMANSAATLRAGGIQVVWLTVVIAGAAIPLSEALIDEGWTWVSPVLGFVIVVAAGVERIFGRTTPAAVALDELRRRLARERRLLPSGADEYADADARFDIDVRRTEAFMNRYDDEMIEYGKRVVEQSS